jgi:hypothetical protein
MTCKFWVGGRPGACKRARSFLPSIEDMNMRTKDRELLNDVSGRCLESMLFRFGQVEELFPRLRPHLSHAALRRAVARLRSGAMPSIDSRIPACALADLLEGSIEQDLLLREVEADMQGFRELEQRLRRR